MYTGKKNKRNKPVIDSLNRVTLSKLRCMETFLDLQSF